MKQSKKYIVVDTWNGDNYSSENGTEIRIFDNKEQASYHCRVEAYKNEEEDVMEVEKVENGYEFYDISEDGVDDSGSYRYYPLPKDAYAVEILCNVNEVRIINQIEFAKAIADREAELQDYLNDEKNVIKDESLQDKREDKAIATDDGIFYHSLDQYDFQYRRLSDVRGIDDNLMKEITLTKQEIDLAIDGMKHYLNHTKHEVIVSAMNHKNKCKAIEILISVLKTNQI